MKNTTQSSLINYETELNAPQREVVTAPDGPILVIAGAGSGKTRTIVYRVAWLVEQGTDPASILLMTFTRKAAEEMLSRAAALLDDRVNRVSGGTFHSTGNLLLRRYGGLIGFDSSFSIMDQGDSLEAIDHIKKSLVPPLLDLKSFPKNRTISAIISRAVNTGGSVFSALRTRYPHLERFGDDIERIRVQYEDHKKSHNLMDYDDLLVNTIQVLEEHEHVREEVSSRWQHLLIDEYQDTNRLQAQIVRLLAYSHDNVMVVGDDSQSVYSFRGADFTNIMEFPDLFPGTRVVKLEENYRSTVPILAVTNAIISQAATGYPKRLFTRRTEGPLPLAVRPYSEREQSQFVIACLRELNGAGIRRGDIAVLFRAGFDSFDLEGELTRNEVPFVKYGGFKFLESLHIKDVLAHLKVLNNYKDRLSWARILKILPGIGVKTSLKLADKIAEAGIPENPTIHAPAGRKYTKDFARLIELIRTLKNESSPISEKVERINHYYFPYLEQNFDNYPKRMRDLDHLADLTVTYKSLNRFLNDMALEPPDTDTPGADSREDPLVLSTIHSAKGLEWHTVIIIWAVEGRIPSPMSADSPDELEEERRLIYVATTRAKHNLVVLAPRTRVDRQQGIIHTAQSRFFDAVPHEYFRSYSGVS
jgi:DNA helicase-2/ATP-dependent DNA helicase PcrA